MKRFGKVIVTTSWDDGHPMDTRLADLLFRYGIHGTFYISPKNREHAVISPMELKELSGRFEIGAHTMTHPRLDNISDSELEREIRGSKEVLEGLMGKPVEMFCYPKGSHNHRVRQAVIDCGLIGARGTLEYHVDPGMDPWRMRTTLQACPHSTDVRLRHSVRVGNWGGIMELFRMGCRRSWVELAYRFFEKAYTEGGVWHLWGHSWEIEERQLWDDLKLVLETVSCREGILFMSNGEVIRALNASRGTPLVGKGR